ncbi:UPF0481 protein At3g47200-like [Tasmannia lanceolata]|uniref:UPF0481 protein At3g47200-like n=1 Tax=Tasmannia lanceolata TaxID=3420 RepID=UPI0040645085
MEEKNWVIKVKEKLQLTNSLQEEQIWKKQSIYRVPSCLTELNPKAYQPQVVSFGPYHHENEQLTQMEVHKQRALLHFLKRTNKSIEDYVKALEEVGEELMDSYEHLEEAWKDRNRFLKMMLLDGCFMLEVLYTANGISNTYASKDPIFSSHGKVHKMPYIKRDMLRVENQLPLLVLDKLVAVEKGTPKNDEFINKLILKFCNPSTLDTNIGPCLHVLDVFRKSMLQGPSPTSQNHAHESTGEIIRSAIELNEAGIRFKKSKTQSLKDIKFKHGILTLPIVVVDDTTESTFLNLMAFERLHVGTGNEVTSYVFFMDNIIDSAKDVSLLHSKGIIQNAVGSDKAVAKLFNQLSKDVTLDPESSLDEVHKEVNKYCRKKWNMYRANLIHTYFRSPWALLSLVAAVFLLGLTVGQTVYSILGYYPH